MSTSAGAKTPWLVTCNVVTALSWSYVFFLVVSRFTELITTTTTGTTTTADGDDSALSFCDHALSSAIHMALMISFIEVVNCVLGLTKSPLPAVLLFSCTRFGVERLIASKIPCTSWQHLLTVTCWSLGDTIRFASLAIVTATSTSNSTTSNKISQFAKSIRFAVGPVLFPVGAGGEMLMVILAGSTSSSSRSKVMYYGAAALWPVFFYPMMIQLLKQRRRHFGSSAGEGKKKQIKSI